MSKSKSTTGAGDKRITVYVLKPNDRPYFKLEWVVPGTTIRKSVSTKTSTSHGLTTASFRAEVTTVGRSTTKRPTFLRA